MPNIHKGEASFTTSAGETYHLVMDFNAFAIAEDAADMDLNSLLRAVSPEIDPATGKVVRQPRIKHLGALLHGALQARHPGTTARQAINLLGSGEEVGAAIAKALSGAMLKDGAESAGGKAPGVPGTGAKPRKAGRSQG